MALEITDQSFEEVVLKRKHIEEGIRPSGFKNGPGPRIASNYFDLPMLMDYWSEARLNHHTEATSMLYAAHECARIVLQCGLQESLDRHALASEAMVAGLQAMDLQIFGDMLPALSDLNKQMKDTQNKIPFQDLDLIMLEMTDDLNQLLATLSNQNIDKLKKPVNQKTLKYFSDLVPENQAMKEIMSYILSENFNKNNTFESGLSGTGLTLNDNGFFDYQSDYLKLNSNAPEKQVTKILNSFNYVSETY